MVSRSWLGVVVIVLAAATAACDKVQLLAPSNSTITVSAPTRNLPLGGSTEITAFVAESSGTAVQNGTVVRFSASLGSIEPVEAQTRNGFATATFTAGSTSGVAEIRAVSGTIGGGTSSPSTGGGTVTPPATGGTTPPATTSTTSGTNVITINIGAAAAGALTLSSSSSSVPPNGGTVTLVAIPVDASGNRLPNVPVTFSTTAGTLSSSSAITDANGEARVTLTTDRAATVTARSGAQTATSAITVAAANTLSLAVAPNPGTVNQPVALTLTVGVGTNNTPSRIVVNWGDGTQEDLGVVSSNRTVTHTYQSTGTFVITATGTGNGETTSSSTTVTINARTAVGVTVTASDGQPGLNVPVTFTANVSGVDSTAVSSYTWQIDREGDDGNVDETVTTTGNQLTRAFNTRGRKTVNVTATTNDGRTGTGQTQVFVP